MTKTDTESLDFAKLLRENPIESLSKPYQSKLINKIKHAFNNKEGQLFVTSFYYYLKCDSNLFIIDLDDIWNWLGFTRKDTSKKLLEKYFKQNIDYKIAENNGGQNREIILMTVKTFKKLCLKANTSKADEIHDYYIKLEEIFHEIINEESSELRDELLQKEQMIVEKDQKLITEQNTNIHLQKSLKRTQTKYSQRHKFEEDDYVYLIYNPDDTLDRSKIGESGKINHRFDSERTMIPDFKIALLIHTPYCEFFEQAVKIKFADMLQGQSEWIIHPRDKIIKAILEINEVCGLHGRLETELWRYNLDKDENVTKVDLSEQIQPIDKFTNILPKRLVQCDYLSKNKQVGEDLRWCNAWCQTHKSISSFFKVGQTYSQNCNICENLADIANIKILNGICTAEDIRKDPSIIPLDSNKKICRKCSRIRSKTEFNRSVHICDFCENVRKQEIGKEFEKVIEDEMQILEKLSYEDKRSKLHTYLAPQLQKIAKYINVDSADVVKKPILIERILNYYVEYDGNNVFNNLNFEQKLSNILPIYINRAGYLKKNSESPVGKRYCRGWCKCFKPFNDFNKNSESMLTICLTCESMLKLVDEKFLKEELTAIEIKGNPSLILLKDNERLCKNCKVIKTTDNFEKKRNTCKSCCHIVRTDKDKEFYKILENEIDNLKTMSEDERKQKLTLYKKTEIHKIAEHLKITRKSTDLKTNMIEKILNYLLTN